MFAVRSLIFEETNVHYNTGFILLWCMYVLTFIFSFHCTYYWRTLYINFVLSDTRQSCNQPFNWLYKKSTKNNFCIFKLSRAFSLEWLEVLCNIRRYSFFFLQVVSLLQEDLVRHYYFFRRNICITLLL